MARNSLALAERSLHRHLHQQLVPLMMLFATIFLPVQSFSVDTTIPTSDASESKKLQLFPYQEKGVQRLCSDRRLILGDDMGLGKTCQAISALNRLCDAGELSPEQGRVLIICPKSVLNVWVDELEQWLDPRLLEPMDIHVCTAGEEPSDSDRGLIQLINYDICHKHKDLLQGQSWDVVICDEAHYLKSHNSKRTLAILGSSTAKSKAGGVTQSASYVWLLTGTPILNRPVELYPLLRALDSSEWGSRKDFIESYCEPKAMKLRGRGRYVTNNNGASNLQELKKRLQPYMLRRYKADVLTDLPPKLRSCVNLDGTDAAVQERRMVAEMMGMDDYVVERYDDAGNIDEEDDERHIEQFAESNSLVSFSAEASALTHYGIKASDFEDDKFLGALAKIRKETAMLKIKPAVALLKDVMACEKVVVFAHHRAIIHALVEEFGNKCVHIIGGMDTENRAHAVRRFQNDDRCRIFIGSIRAAGVGVTLTAASHVVFLELDWSPAIMAQAEDRCHRVGQQDSVLCQYYVFRDTIDEWIAKTIIKKDVVATMALPTDRDTTGETGGVTENDESEGSNAYVFDFGKHKGIRIEDVPESYLMWLVTNESIWKKRPELWRALAHNGLIRDEPPPADVGREAKRPTYVISNDAPQQLPGKVDYVFNFGKHRSEQWEDVPISYRDWVVKNEVWKNRPDLKEALQSAGVINVD